MSDQERKPRPDPPYLWMGGYATSDPKFSDKGKTPFTYGFGLAINGYDKEDDERFAIFIDVKAFGRVAEESYNYIKKGDLISVRGRLTVEQYPDRSGEKVKKLALVAEHINYNMCDGYYSYQDDQNGNNSQTSSSRNKRVSRSSKGKSSSRSAKKASGGQDEEGW